MKLMPLSYSPSHTKACNLWRAKICASFGITNSLLNTTGSEENEFLYIVIDLAKYEYTCIFSINMNNLDI